VTPITDTVLKKTLWTYTQPLFYVYLKITPLRDYFCIKDFHLLTHAGTLGFFLATILSVKTECPDILRGGRRHHFYRQELPPHPQARAESDTSYNSEECKADFKSIPLSEVSRCLQFSKNTNP